MYKQFLFKLSLFFVNVIRFLIPIVHGLIFLVLVLITFSFLFALFVAFL